MFEVSGDFCRAQSGFVVCTEVVRGQGVKGYPSFDSENTAILDLTKRRQIDAVSAHTRFSSRTLGSARDRFQPSLAATNDEVSGHPEQAPALNLSPRQRGAAARAAAGCKREPAPGSTDGQLTVDEWGHEGASLLSLKRLSLGLVQRFTFIFSTKGDAVGGKSLILGA